MIGNLRKSICEEIGKEKIIHGVKVVSAQTPCEVVNVLPSLQFEREQNPCALVKSEAKRIGVERSKAMTN